LAPCHPAMLRHRGRRLATAQPGVSKIGPPYGSARWPRRWVPSCARRASCASDGLRFRHGQSRARPYRRALPLSGGDDDTVECDFAAGTTFQWRPPPGRITGAYPRTLRSASAGAGRSQKVILRSRIGTRVTGQGWRPAHKGPSAQSSQGPADPEIAPGIKRVAMIFNPGTAPGGVRRNTQRWSFP